MQGYSLLSSVLVDSDKNWNHRKL